MANGDVFNVSKGRVAEFHNRVDTGDPTTSRIGILALRTANLEPDTTLIRRATISALLTGGTTREVANTGYARLVMTASDTPAIAPDNVLDQMVCDLPDAAFGSITAGDGWSKLVIYYIPIVGTSTDTNCIPLTLHDFTATPAGVTITATITGYFKAIKGA